LYGVNVGSGTVRDGDVGGESDVMKILVVGGGGREHVLCWKLARAARVWCAPGNAGTATVAKNVRVAANDIDGLLDFAKRERMDLTVVGPEEPLCDGIVDRFQEAGLRIFGPTAAAARLEGDKAFAKKLMRECGVPTAEARVFGPTEQELAHRRQAGEGRDEAVPRDMKRGYDLAREYVLTRETGLVVKAAGLAKGKGAFVHDDPHDAVATLEALMVRHTLGAAGERVLIEERLTGPEVSVMALVDGRNIYMLETASDHKRIGEGDTGANTGGMGAYSPSDALSDDDLSMIERQVFVRIVDGLKREGVTYRGVLYAGLMVTSGGPRVLEFNCRFGDPEAQVVLMRLKSDLSSALNATVDGCLDRIRLDWEAGASVCVVAASEGYPAAYECGKVIDGLDTAAAVDGVAVFHAGTARHAGEVVTAGGRVLGVTARGASPEAARERAYQAMGQIGFDGMQFRRDIGLRTERA